MLVDASKLGRRHPRDAAKRSREVTLIGEPAFERDVAERVAGDDSFLRLLHAGLPNRFADRAAVMTAERAREMRRMNIRFARQRGEGESGVEVRRDHRSYTA